MSFGVMLKIFLFIITKMVISQELKNVTQKDFCPFYKSGPCLEINDLIGSWMTVYVQPSTIDCFTLHIRATTDLERERFMMKYGNYSGRVNWNLCLLEVVSPLGKHYLQGDGSDSGLLDNVIILESSDGESIEYTLQEQSADQWTVFGRRGSEILVMRDCWEEAAAAFARAHFWPTAHELVAILHRSGIAPHPQAHGRALCEPKEPTRELWINKHSSP